MKVVLQRVNRASVTVQGKLVAAMERGLLVLLGVGKKDTTADADYLVAKTLGLRVFPDDEGRMNRSLVEIGGSLMVVSQFTLYGDCRKGRRPSFDDAAAPDAARLLYDYFCEAARRQGIDVRTGVFQASMQVELVNDGPVTLIYESPFQ